MKIVIPGGSGQVGTVLARAFTHARHDVVVLTRKPVTVNPSGTVPGNTTWRTATWDGQTLGEWTRHLESADAVINLAGRSVNCRYGPRNRKLIMDSRIDSTRILGQAIAQAVNPPRVWLQASTATIYAHRYDAPNDEATGILGGNEPNLPDTWRFSYGVAGAWERTLNQAVTPRTRKVLMRSAIVMSPDPGGAFAAFLWLVRHGLGGKTGDGKQFVSWVHDQDFARAVLWLIDHDEIAGPVNIASPHPLPNADFMRGLRRAWGIRVGLPASHWMVEAGTFIMRSESELVLKSRRVDPGRLLQAGFTFEFPTWPEAADDLCRRWRTAPAHRQLTGSQ